MKTNNFKKQLFSFTMTSALVLSSLSGAITPMVHAEQKGIKDEVAVTSSKEGNNQSSQTSASEENVTAITKDTKKVEETTTSKSVETKSEKAVQKQTNTATSALQQATNTVNNLFYGNDENHPKPSNTNAQIDATRKQVTALPNSDQKTALLKKVEKAQQAYDKLMEQWKDVNETMDRFFVNGDIGNPKPDVTTDDLIMLSEKMFVFPLEEEFLEGYTMSELRKKRDQLNYVLNVTPLVKWLFTNGKPSPVNTQDDISYALSRVNEMYDGPYKQKLIEKIQEAQKAYNDAHIFVDPVADQAMEAVKQLFDGDTPKKDNTQEKIDAARKKVEAIKGFDTVKAGLLEKIKVAQAALDDKKQAITVDAYYYGNVYMTGQYSGNIKKFKLTVDGKEYTPGFKLLKNNRFELYIGKKITKGTKTVKVESFDETGKVTGTREITIQTPKLTVENYTLGQEYIKGQTVGEAKQFKLVVDGKEFSAGFKLLENNQFEVYAKNKVQSNSKKVVLKVLNGEGTEIATQEVAVQQPALEVNYYKVNTDYITGTYTGDVKKFKLIVDGQEYFPGFKLLANNQFEVYAKNKVSASSKSITLVSLNAQGKETQRQAVSVINTAIETTLTEATTTVNNLFYGNDENHAKPSNTNAQIDAARKQVNALPDSAQKSVLLKKVEKAQQAYDELMEQWKDVNETMDRFFVNGDIGNPKPDVTTDDIIMLSQKMFVFPIDEEFLEGYTMNELRKKMNQLTYMLNVTPIVKRLFVNGKPSPINTQREITYALGRVNEMYDGPYKQKLIEKIQEAQQAYNAAHHK